ncbi:hypothetical protein BH23PLA1_BH23PLA1_19550 [soil metagenome]
MLRLGTVTYNIAKDWDLDEILKRLEAVKFEGVELRTTHAHGVEVDLTPEQREEVRKRFADSPVELVGLGSAFEYHSANPAEVKRHIEQTKEYVKLAHDVGAPGVKVRPNGVPKGADPEATFRQIGEALNEVGEHAEGFGVEIRVEVHGAVTQVPQNFTKIMQYAEHPNVTVCWNSNPADVMDGSVSEFFQAVGPRIRLVHLRDLYDEQYPWPELFALLVASGYQGFTLAEIADSPDADRVLRYYRALWLAYQP